MSLNKNLHKSDLAEKKSPLHLSTIFSENNSLNQCELNTVLTFITEKLNDEHPALTVLEIEEITRKINISLNIHLQFDYRIVRRTSRLDEAKPVYTVLPGTDVMAEGSYGMVNLPIAEFKWDENNTLKIKHYHNNQKKIVKEIKILSDINQISIKDRYLAIATLLSDAQEELKYNNIDEVETLIKTLHEALDDLYQSEKSLHLLQSEFKHFQTLYANSAEPEGRHKSFHLIRSLGLMFMPYQQGETLSMFISKNKIDNEYERFNEFIKVHKALMAFHQKGLVHNDFRTPNIIRKANGEIAIVDLGLTVRQGEQGKSNISLACAPPELYEFLYQKNTNMEKIPADYTHDIPGLALVLAAFYNARSRIWTVEEIEPKNDVDPLLPSILDKIKAELPSLVPFYIALDKLEKEIKQLKNEALNNSDSDIYLSDIDLSDIENTDDESDGGYADLDSVTKTDSNIDIESDNEYIDLDSVIETNLSQKNESSSVQDNDLNCAKAVTIIKHAIAHLVPVQAPKKITEHLELVLSKPNAPVKITGVTLPGFLENCTLPEFIQDMIKELCYGMLNINPAERFSHAEISNKSQRIAAAIYDAEESKIKERISYA